MSRLVIFGAGGMGREAFDLAKDREPERAIVFAVDGGGDVVNGIAVIDPAEIRADDQIVIALGDGRARRAIAERMVGRASATLVSKTARLSPFVTLGEGALIADFAVINSGAQVGRHFQANCFAQVSHDCRIGDFVTLSPHVSCNGWVDLGDDVFVGAGAIIRNGTPNKRLAIGAGAVIGMGAVVTEDVPAGARVYAPKAVIRER